MRLCVTSVTGLKVSIVRITIHFGLNFDDCIYPAQEQCVGTTICGEKGLLAFLERQLGCGGYDERVEHIRVEQYRYALDKYAARNPDCFFVASFKADALACAEDLLQRRDELVLAGWNFDPDLNSENIPARLKVFRDIERTRIETENKTREILLAFGFADRFNCIIHLLSAHQLPIEKIIVNEPIALLPPHIKRFLDVGLWTLNVEHLKKEALEKDSDNNKIQNPKSDLDIFKKFITRQFSDTAKHDIKNDGSILILKAGSDADAAPFLSRFLEANTVQNKTARKDFFPVLLIPDKHRSIDEACIQNGLPALGLPSASLGRPTLQLLKLVTAFLWQPLDPQKILEFVTLQYKPLHYELAGIIADVISQRPGIGNEKWQRETHLFFENLEVKALADTTVNVGKTKKQFDFWFNRNTYTVNQTVPRDEIIEIYAHLREWAKETFENNGSKNTSLLVLGEQSRRIEEYLIELAETGKNFLSRLDIERIIRTVYEAAPVQPMPQQVSAFPFVKNECCITENITDLIWWQFTEQENPFFFPAWYPDEMNWLNGKNIALQTPKQKTELWLWKQKQPVERVQNRLILVEMYKCQGENKNEHALMSYLRACFNDLSKVTLDVGSFSETLDFGEISGSPSESVFPISKVQLPKSDFIFPRYQKEAQQFFAPTQPFMQLDAERLTPRETETPTSLEALFYYPHQWVFKYVAKINRSALAGIVKDKTLKGNVAHRFFELILKENFSHWSRQDVNKWIDIHHLNIMRTEAVPFLLYGNEPEKLYFIDKMKYAVWVLMVHIRENNWSVVQTEKELNGTLCGKPLKGKTDIVLQRDNEFCIVDLKWSGLSYRETLIKNSEDLQLVLYAKLLHPEERDKFAYSAYFIIEKAHLMARTKDAFKNVKPLMPDADTMAVNRQIFDKMEKTYQWRMRQIEFGKIEIRVQHNIQNLEQHYADELLPLLEMKKGNAAFDDYLVLLGF